MLYIYKIADTLFAWTWCSKMRFYTLQNSQTILCQVWH